MNQEKNEAIFCPMHYQIEIKQNPSWLHSVWVGCIWSPIYMIVNGLLIQALLISALMFLLSRVQIAAVAVVGMFKMFIAGISGNASTRQVSEEEFAAEILSRAVASAIEDAKAAAK